MSPMQLFLALTLVAVVAGSVNARESYNKGEKYSTDLRERCRDCKREVLKGSYFIPTECCECFDDWIVVSDGDVSKMCIRISDVQRIKGDEIVVHMKKKGDAARRGFYRTRDHVVKATKTAGSYLDGPRNFLTVAPRPEEDEHFYEYYDAVVDGDHVRYRRMTTHFPEEAEYARLNFIRGTHLLDNRYFGKKHYPRQYSLVVHEDDEGDDDIDIAVHY